MVCPSSQWERGGLPGTRIAPGEGIGEASRPRGGDLHCCERHLPVAGASDLRDEIEALDHLAKNGVAIVQVRSRDLSDEELAAVGVGARIGHREQDRLDEAPAPLELVLEGRAGPAGALPERVAAL